MQYFVIDNNIFSCYLLFLRILVISKYPVINSSTMLKFWSWLNWISKWYKERMNCIISSLLCLQKYKKELCKKIYIDSLLNY